MVVIKATERGNLALVGGTALTGRDWSGDFAKLQNLDVLLSSVRDSLNIAKVGGTAQTGRDWSSDLAKLQNLDVAVSALRTVAGNLRASLQEQAILLGVDNQAHYAVSVVRDIAPTAVGTFWLPETGAIDLSNFISSSWFIYAPATTGMVISCHLQISHDGGATFRRLAGYSILDADFQRGMWNVIHCNAMLARAKLEVVISGAYPSELDLMVIAKA